MVAAVSCCAVAAIVARLTEFTIVDLFINEPGKVRVKATYPLVTYCDSHVTSDAQQRCTIILFVLVIVGVAVTGVGLIVDIASVNLATLIF